MRHSPIRKMAVFLFDENHSLYFFSYTYTRSSVRSLRSIYGSFKAGISHPILGLDHLLAIVSVGVISNQMGGIAILAVPTTFVGFIALGGILGMINIGLFPVELGIALSVLMLGLAMASNAKIYNSLIYAAVGMFGIFQEYAHGLEIPQLATSWSYVAGCIVGTALLHLVGVYLGRSSEKIKFEQTYLRYAGAVSAGIGLHIILGMAGFYRRRKRIRFRGIKKLHLIR